MLYDTLLYESLLYNTWLFDALLYNTLLYDTLLYDTLLYELQYGMYRIFFMYESFPLRVKTWQRKKKTWTRL